VQYSFDTQQSVNNRKHCSFVESCVKAVGETDFLRLQGAKFAMGDIYQYFMFRKNYRQSFYNNKPWKEKSQQHLILQRLFLYNILINIYSPDIMRSYDIQKSRKTINLKKILIFRVVECNFTCWPCVVWRKYHRLFS